MTDTATDPVRDEIMEHMARAFFACAWADWTDEFGEGTQGNGVDIMDEMPETIDGAATLAAAELTRKLEALHGRGIADIFVAAKTISRRHKGYQGGDRRRTAEMFGHYAAMGAMGHGVSLYDALGTKAAEYVNTHACYMEFSPFDLNPAEYPIPAEAG
jgi:hypothetical protein